MTLEQLRIFVAVAERQHVTRAARDLNLTQSATSAAIAVLEQRYATRLFDRVGRRIELTEAGRLFLAEAKAILARVQDAETMLMDLADLRHGTLAVAASQTIGTFWLPHLVRRFRAGHPGVAVTVEIGNTEFVAARVRDGYAALGFVEGPVAEPLLAAEALRDDELVLVAPPGHAWAAAGLPNEPDTLRACLAGADWVVREQGSGTRVAMEDVLATYGVAAAEIRVAMELPSNEAVRTAVEAGIGLTILSRLVVEVALAAGVLGEVALALPRRRFYALRHRERYASSAAERFVALAREAAPA
jgi:DNA-binding transcriptional LysR family regulator